MNQKVFSAVALITAAGLLMVFASPSFRQGERSVAGRTPPDFAFTLDGKPTSLAEQRGKVVVVNFWATWCPPCVDEMPALNRLHQILLPEGGLVVGVSVDENSAAYENFLQQYQIRFPNYREPTRQLSADYGSVMYPETYIIGRDGRMARKIIGPQEWDKPPMLEYLRGLLAQQR
ncbi:MAG TPA: TlpA disulfide reductase family protein [Candidatus Acidoferrales bacterium]